MHLAELNQQKTVNGVLRRTVLAQLLLLPGRLVITLPQQQAEMDKNTDCPGTEMKPQDDESHGVVRRVLQDVCSRLFEPVHAGSLLAGRSFRLYGHMMNAELLRKQRCCGSDCLFEFS